jgi:hypothetical protein
VTTLEALEPGDSFAVVPLRRTALDVVLKRLGSKNRPGEHAANPLRGLPERRLSKP